MRKISQKGLDLLKKLEGFSANSYKDSGGVWTVGYGTTKGVYAGLEVCQEEAEHFLQRDLEATEKAVETAIKVPLNDNEFAALVVFAYNVGIGAFKLSTLLKMLNSGYLASAADQFARWNKVNGVEVKGLTNRREAEHDLFLDPVT